MSGSRQTHIDIASAGAYVVREEAMVSTETLKCFASNKNPAEAMENNAPVRPDVKTLRDGGYREVNSGLDGQTRTADTHSVQKQASFLHVGQFNLGAMFNVRQ